MKKLKFILKKFLCFLLDFIYSHKFFVLGVANEFEYHRDRESESCLSLKYAYTKKCSILFYTFYTKNTLATAERVQIDFKISF